MNRRPLPAIEFRTDDEGWTRRYVDGRLSYIRCPCDAPVERVKNDFCEECWAIVEDDDVPDDHIAGIDGDINDGGDDP